MAKQTRTCCFCGHTSDRKMYKETNDGKWLCLDSADCFERKNVCWLCGGSGKDPHFSLNVCPECRGTGVSIT